jgi:hypothetical protein
MYQYRAKPKTVTGKFRVALCRDKFADDDGIQCDGPYKVRLAFIGDTPHGFVRWLTDTMEWEEEL